jgi:hypothetical protein
MKSLLNLPSTTSSQAHWDGHPLGARPERRHDLPASGAMPLTPSTRPSWNARLLIAGLSSLFLLTVSFNGAAQEPPPSESSTVPEQTWNLHLQNTDIVQGYPPFSAKYSAANSLPTGGQIRETVAVDLFAGARLWRGAEAHLDLLAWQGFGLHTL